MPPKLPVALYTGGNDELADPTDAANLIAQLSNSTTYSRQIPVYAHLDYVWAIDAVDQIYQQVFGFFDQWVTANPVRKPRN